MKDAETNLWVLITARDAHRPEKPINSEHRESEINGEKGHG